MEKSTFITVKTTLELPLEKVWEVWNNPKDIVNWYFASPDWHTPRAENDPKVGGRFNYRMEAKNGSFGFDFSGTYTNVVENKLLEITLDDERKMTVKFAVLNNKVIVTEVFEAEVENSVEMQRGGWQAILDNFKLYIHNKEV